MTTFVPLLALLFINLASESLSAGPENIMVASKTSITNTLPSDSPTTSAAIPTTPDPNTLLSDSSTISAATPTILDTNTLPSDSPTTSAAIPTTLDTNNLPSDSPTISTATPATPNNLPSDSPTISTATPTTPDTNTPPSDSPTISTIPSVSATTEDLPTSSSLTTIPSTSSPQYTTSFPKDTTLTSSSTVEITTTSPIQSTNEMSSTEESNFTSSEPAQEVKSTPDPSASSTNKPDAGTSGFCQASSCGGGASCINLYDSHFCLCPEGDYYASAACLQGKTFPGTITKQVSEISDLQNKTSLPYQKLHHEIVTFFQQAFTNTDYKETVIHRVSTSPPARSSLVHVTVVNIFAQDTTEDETSVSDKIKDEIKTSNSSFIYSELDQCAFRGCKENEDNCNNSLSCECDNGLQRPFPQSPFCLALRCDDSCNAEFNKQCLNEDVGTLKCMCLPGYKADGHGDCQECPFGYSGVNCEDQFQLILTIVGTILGVLILSLVIALIFSMRSKNRRKNTEEQNLIENDFQNMRLQQTGFSNLGAEGSIFPKVKTSPPQGYQVQNPYTSYNSASGSNY